jgi:alkanesulfonate monooxygenase SsuD/methylene tetrahydromethanopterin reductase-like flavin-dependent oxidoreductase (luciferase family)
VPTRDSGVRVGLTAGRRNFAELAELWEAAEEMGYDSLWMADHIMSEGYDTSSGEPVPTDPDAPPLLVPMLECWTLLAGLARMTRNVTIGTIVSPVTFRYPAMLWKQALTVDEMTGGRLTLGLGAAYTEREHRAFGLPYPPPAERVEMLAETLAIYRLFENEDYATFKGRYYMINQAPCAPKPVNGHIPIMIGGARPKMMRLTAKYADHYNAVGSPNWVRDRYADLDRYCEEIGRDPAEIHRSVGLFFSPVDPLSSLDRALHVIERFRSVGAAEIIFPARDGHRTVIEELAAHLE